MAKATVEVTAVSESVRDRFAENMEIYLRVPRLCLHGLSRDFMIRLRFRRTRLCR